MWLPKTTLHDCVSLFFSYSSIHPSIHNLHIHKYLFINSYIHPSSSIVIYPSFYIYLSQSIQLNIIRDVPRTLLVMVENVGRGWGSGCMLHKENFDHGPLKRAIWHNLRINLHFIFQYHIYEHLVVKQCNYNGPIDIILLYIHCESMN